MFSKILGNMKSSSSEENHEKKELIVKIAKMNLTEMRTYINNRIVDNPVCEYGLSEILNKLLKVDNKTSKRYINIDDMDSKKKKGFDLVLSILTNKKITVEAIELANEFLKVYTDIIDKYDIDYKEIYSVRFKDAIILAVDDMNAKSELHKKMNLIYD
jgi:hypothetical protein